MNRWLLMEKNRAPIWDIVPQVHALKTAPPAPAISRTVRLETAVTECGAIPPAAELAYLHQFVKARYRVSPSSRQCCVPTSTIEIAGT
jgi:hypothetical protein